MRCAAERCNLADSIAELRRWPLAATLCWARPPASRRGRGTHGPSTHVGHELIGAGMLIMAGGSNGTPLDYEELERWTRVGYERV
jgi:hypothetical protein